MATNYLKDGQYYVRERLEELSQEHGFYYTLDFSNRMTRCLGKVKHFSTPLVTFNNHYIQACVENGEINALENTILHEVAHILAGGKHHHDYYWYSIARKIGCDGSRLSKVEFYDKPKAKKVYIYKCAKCGHEFRRYRKLSGGYQHTSDKGDIILDRIEEN